MPDALIYGIIKLQEKIKAGDSGKLIDLKPIMLRGDEKRGV